VWQDPEDVGRGTESDHSGLPEGGEAGALRHREARGDERKGEQGDRGERRPSGAEAPMSPQAQWGTPGATAVARNRVR
jgi:hypothetical protein